MPVSIKKKMKGKTKKSNKKWKCLVCGATGKRLLNSWKANRSGRQHINNKHNRLGQIVIMCKDFY